MRQVIRGLFLILLVLSAIVGAFGFVFAPAIISMEFNNKQFMWLYIIQFTYICYLLGE